MKNCTTQEKKRMTAAAKKIASNRYRVVYGETMPAWEQSFPTMREADAFAEKHRGFGDVIFSIKKIVPNDREPHSIMGAIAKAEGCQRAAPDRKRHKTRSKT